VKSLTKNICACNRKRGIYSRNVEKFLDVKEAIIILRRSEVRATP
jgi:hypothetical protein